MPKTDPASGLTPSDIRATLDRLLISAPFCKSAQLTNFLRYVVEETLAGRGGRIEAYSIATTALGAITPSIRRPIRSCGWRLAACSAPCIAITPTATLTTRP